MRLLGPGVQLSAVFRAPCPAGGARRVRQRSPDGLGTAAGDTEVVRARFLSPVLRGMESAH